MQAQCGLLYDVLNDLGLALTLGQRQGETSVLLTVLSRNTRSRQPCASGSSASF